MKLSDLEATHSYEDLIAWLKTPDADRPTDTSDGRTEAGRLPLSQLLSLLRETQGNHLVRFAVSPRIDTRTSRPGEQPVYALNAPRNVAMQFLDEVLREIRVTGLWVPNLGREVVRFPFADRFFVTLLQWMIRMDSLPLDDRSPFIIEREFLNWFSFSGEEPPLLGPILNGFLLFYYREYSRPPRLLPEFFRDPQSNSALTSITALLSNEPVLVDPEWAFNFLMQGAEQLYMLGNGPPETRPRMA